MATITLFADGTVEARYAGGVCVYIDVKTFADKGQTILHSYDTLGIHGTPAQIRAFAQAILAALPPVGDGRGFVVEPEPRDAGELFAAGRKLVIGIERDSETGEARVAVHAPGSDLLRG